MTFPWNGFSFRIMHARSLENDAGLDYLGEIETGFKKEV